MDLEVTHKAADEAGDEEDDCGGEEDAVGDDQLVEQGGVGLSSKEADPGKLVTLNLAVYKSLSELKVVICY